MTAVVADPVVWDEEFENSLYQKAVDKYRPDLPAELPAPPRDLATAGERLDFAEYWARLAAHDIFIVQVVSRALGTLVKDIEFKRALARQVGDDGFHAVVAAERASQLYGRDAWPDVHRYVAEYWERLGDLPTRSLPAFIAFEFHIELYIIAKFTLHKRQAERSDHAMKAVGVGRIVPDEAFHRQWIVSWWQRFANGLEPEQREEFIDALIEADNEFQKRHNPYLRLSYDMVERSYGSDLKNVDAIYDDFRRQALSALTGRPFESLGNLVHYKD